MFVAEEFAKRGPGFKGRGGDTFTTPKKKHKFELRRWSFLLSTTERLVVSPSRERGGKPKGNQNST